MIIFKKQRKCERYDKRYVARRNAVRATGNKWANENFNNLNRRY